MHRCVNVDLRSSRQKKRLFSLLRFTYSFPSDFLSKLVPFKRSDYFQRCEILKVKIQPFPLVVIIVRDDLIEHLYFFVIYWWIIWFY